MVGRGEAPLQVESKHLGEKAIIYELLVARSDTPTTRTVERVHRLGLCAAKISYIFRTSWGAYIVQAFC